MKDVNIKVLETLREGIKYTTSIVVVSSRFGDQVALCHRVNGTPLADGEFFQMRPYTTGVEQVARLKTVVIGRFKRGCRSPLSRYSRTTFEALCSAGR